MQHRVSATCALVVGLGAACLWLRRQDHCNICHSGRHEGLLLHSGPLRRPQGCEPPQNAIQAHTQLLALLCSAVRHSHRSVSRVIAYSIQASVQMPALFWSAVRQLGRSMYRVTVTRIWLQELERKLAKCPVEAGTFPHWLIINGKQPAIPENAIISRRQPPAKRRKVALDQKPGEAPVWASHAAMPAAGLFILHLPNSFQRSFQLRCYSLKQLRNELPHAWLCPAGPLEADRVLCRAWQGGHSRCSRS